ncbi:MAG: sulfurase, partial [Pseudomonadota bacterium]
MSECLVESKFVGTITWLGVVPPDPTGIRSAKAEATDASFEGIAGEHHSGTTRKACSRVWMLHNKGTEIRNTRQLSILSAEEAAVIAQKIGVDDLDPEWLGASIVVSGIPDWSHVPPGSRIQTEAKTTITIDLENGPCNLPGKEIEADAPGHGKAFKAAAEGRRGVT